MFTFTSNQKPPSTNDLYFRKDNRYILKPEVRLYKTAVDIEYKPQIEAQLEELQKLTTDDKLELSMYVQDDWMTKKGTIRKIDLDNTAKAAIDSLFQTLERIGLIIDDSQVFVLHMYKVEEQDCVVKIEFDVI